MDCYVDTNGIRLHYLDYGGTGQPMILMHGLTANAHSFDGLIRAGLNTHARVLAVDLRGRGLSDKPDTGYRMENHAQDILSLMDALKFESAILVGHSFGGLLAMYLAANYPQRVTKLVIMDAGILHPNVRDLIKPSLERLGKPVPSLDAYLNAVKASPYFHDGFWDEDVEAYYRADVELLPDGSVRSLSRPDAIAEAVEGTLVEDWLEIMGRIAQPALMVHAVEGVGPAGTPPVITVEGARQTVEALGNCRYYQATGHHVTMMFGKNAPGVAQAIIDFVNAPPDSVL